MAILIVVIVITYIAFVKMYKKIFRMRQLRYTGNQNLIKKSKLNTLILKYLIN